jgi:hypothetical protein
MLILHCCRNHTFRAGCIKRTRVMSFTATFVSIAVIVGAAAIVLTAVVGFGCYRFLRDLFGKAPKQA